MERKYANCLNSLAACLIRAPQASDSDILVSDYRYQSAVGSGSPLRSAQFDSSNLTAFLLKKFRLVISYGDPRSSDNLAPCEKS
jgi:hypothetical protein